MPIPFILGGIAIVAGLAGAGAHINASEKRDKAKKLYKDSDEKQKKYLKLLDYENERTIKIEENLGKLKLDIASTTIKRFIDVYKKLQHLNIKKISSKTFDIKLTAEEFQRIEAISMTASEMLGAGVSSLAAGALAGYGAYGGAMALGTASTGAQIASLAGAAATRATLAWLGGGAISAGGGGMALGQVVLGGLVTGPAILVSGIFADNKAEKALTEAQNFCAEVDTTCEKWISGTHQLQAIQVRCREFETILKEFSNRLNNHLNTLDYISEILKQDEEPSEYQMNVIHMCLSLAKNIKDILEINILEKDAITLTNESGIIILKAKEVLISLE